MMLHRCDASRQPFARDFPLQAARPRRVRDDACILKYLANNEAPAVPRPMAVAAEVGESNAPRVPHNGARPPQSKLMSAERIHLPVPHMSGHETQYVAKAFATDWLTSVGKNIDEFEREIEGLLPGPRALAVSSGTAALHLILRALGVGSFRN
jgi:hypothetical protein